MVPTKQGILSQECPVSKATHLMKQAEHAMLSKYHPQPSSTCKQALNTTRHREQESNRQKIKSMLSIMRHDCSLCNQKQPKFVVQNHQ